MNSLKLAAAKLRARLAIQRLRRASKLVFTPIQRSASSIADQSIARVMRASRPPVIIARVA